MPASIRADLVLGAAYGLGLSVVLWTVALATPDANSTLLLFLALGTVLGSVRGRVRRFGTLTPLYPMALAGLLLFGPGASILSALLTAITAALLHSRPSGRPSPGAHTAFELSSVAIGTTFAALAWLAAGGSGGWAVVAHAAVFGACRLCLARVGLYTLHRRRALLPLWRGVLRAVPVYAGGAALAAGFARLYAHPETRGAALAAVLLGLALAAARTARGTERLLLRERRKTGALYCSVAEALAKTMEAADQGTREHLGRVQELSLAVGERLGLAESEMQALGTAALLHDIGKLAVPEGILTKPGRLTQAEMEKVKTHAAVGADILQSIPFPYPLSPIVRHHHERWDGRGYPAGLSGEAIPVGSRILSVVDSYDALTSDRPYRKALSHDEAVAFLHREADRMFDGRVVDALIDQLDGGIATRAPQVEQADDESRSFSVEVEPSVAGKLPLAQRELNVLYDIAHAMDYGLDMEEHMTLVGCKLAEIVPFRSMVAYFLDPDDGVLRAGFAMGKAADKLRLTTIQLGDRLSGWAALQQRAFIGQDHLTPLDRDGTRSDLEDWEADAEMRSLCSTLAAPMVSGEQNVGVLTLYDHSGRSFTADDRRLVIRTAGYVAQVARSLRGRTLPDASLTDPLTGVPNARFLWLEAAHRISQIDGRSGAFGLLAFRLSGLDAVGERLGNEAADRLLSQIARRLAAGCDERETLVRFGQDLFLVLTAAHEANDLTERNSRLAAEVEQPAFAVHSGIMQRVRVTSAYASCPEDGGTLDALLKELDSRLCRAIKGSRTVLPFRPRQSTA